MAAYAFDNILIYCDIEMGRGEFIGSNSDGLGHLSKSDLGHEVAE